MVDALVSLVQPLPAFDRIASGLPGVVRENCVLTAPHFRQPGWQCFPPADASSERLGGKPARLLDDA